MALEINDTTFSGDALDILVTKATTDFDTFNKGCISVTGGIKKSRAIPRLKISGFIQAHSEEPVHGGKINIDARHLTPKNFMGFLKFNPRVLESHWKAVEMNPKLLDAELPVTVENAVASKIIDLNKQYMDMAIWQSVYDAAAVSTALTNGLQEGDNNLIFLDGFMKKMYLTPGVIKITGVDAVALTEENIFAKFKVVKTNRPKAIKDHPKGKYLISYNTAEIFENAQQAQNYKGANVTEAGKMSFGGQPVVKLAGVPDNTIIYTIASADLESNLWMGVNELNEEEYMKLARLAPSSELFFIKMLFQLDVNFAEQEEIVIYTTLTYV